MVEVRVGVVVGVRLRVLLLGVRVILLRSPATNLVHANDAVAGIRVVVLHRGAQRVRARVPARVQRGAFERDRGRE